MADQLPDDHYRPTYEEIHLNIQETALDIKSRFNPDLMVAIAGGGLFPGRVLRTYLKRPSDLDPERQRNIPLQAIGLSLYEEVSGSNVGLLGKEVVRTQWLDAKSIRGAKQEAKVEEGKDAGGLLGKSVLIVDEVDDSRTTLEYAYAELLKDVREALAALSPEARATIPPTRFGIFVVNNKERPKKGKLPIYPKDVTLESEPIEDGIGKGCWYWSAQDTGDVWVEYPWEQTDILEHNRLAALARKLGVNQPRNKAAA